MKFTISNIRTKLFLFAYSLILAYSFIGSSLVFDSLFTILTKVSFFIFISLFITSTGKFTYKELLSIFCLFVVFLIISFNAKSYSLVKLILFTLAFKDINFKKCIVYDIKLRVFLIFLVLGLYYFGMLSDVVSTRQGVVSRHSYGFANPNALALAVTILCMEFMYVYDNTRHLFFKMFCVISVMTIISHITDSRTSLYTISIYLLLILFLRRSPSIASSEKFIKLIQITPLLLALLTFMMVHTYLTNPFSDTSLKYDKVLSGRLSIAATFFSKIPITFLGYDTSSSSLDMSLDNFYVSLLLSSGIFVFLLFFISYWILINRLYRKGQIVLLYIYFCFTIMGLGERLWFAADYNLLMLSFSSLLLKNED